jgi:enterochelin esterase-like enzyme
MDLTSSTLEYGAGLLTILSVGATLWLWPRLARPGLRRVAARLVLILASQLSLVLLAALLLNAYGDFYPTWTDLVGGGNATVTLGRVSGGGSGGSEEQVSDLGSRLVVPAPVGALQRRAELPSGPPQRNGRFSAVTVVGERTGYRQPAYVYLPPQYFQSAYQHVDFPVLTSYVGYPGSIQTMVDRLRMPQIAARMMQDGQMQPTILVIISQTVAPPRDTDCINAPDGGPQAETYLTQDVPAALRSAYRVERDPRGWGLTGVSEGATCALENTLRHPGVFGVAASLGGEYWEYETSTTGVLFGPRGPARDALLNSYNLVWRLQHLPVPDVRVLVATTAHGEHDYKGTQLFVQAAKAPLQITPLVLSSGGHNYSTWSLELEPALAWLGQQLNPPTATPVVPAPAPRTVANVPSLIAVPG